MLKLLRSLGDSLGRRAPAVEPVPPPTTSGRLAADPAVVVDQLDGRLILVQLRTGATFRLNPTGSLIWRLASAGATEAAILEQLVVAFPAVAASRLQTDTRTLLAGLLRNELLQSLDEAHA